MPAEARAMGLGGWQAQLARHGWEAGEICEPFCATISAMNVSRVDVERVEEALEVMACKVDRANPIGLAVESANISRRQLERHFHNLGTSPHKELCRIRVELAAGELASETGASSRLEGLSKRLGFQDERRLRETVGKAFGLSPREIRAGAKLHRSLCKDEEIRRQERGNKESPTGLWSAYRRRRKREKLQGLLRKAKPAGAKVVLGEAPYPRPSQARKMAPHLARSRVLQLLGTASEPRKRAA